MDGDALTRNCIASFDEIKSNGPPSTPVSFDPPHISRGERVDTAVYNPATQDIRHVHNIVYERYPDGRPPSRAYWIGRKQHDCIFGVTRYCTVLNFRNDLDVPWEVTDECSIVKIVSWEKMRSKAHVENPKQEVSAMQLLASKGTHPNVIYPMDVFEDDDYLFIFMPVCDSGELFSFVKDANRPFPEPMARYWFRQIVSGIEHMKRMGVCHRDMSLENVLVHKLQNSVIIDMGMSFRIPYVSRDGTGVADVSAGTKRLLVRPDIPCGKRYYISPEVLESREPFDGFAIDLWAAGVMLFMMLTRRPPWELATEDDPNFRAISQGGLERVLRTHGPPISVAAIDLLQRMLLKDPRQRLTLSQIKEHPWYQEEVPEVGMHDPTAKEGWRY